MNTHFYLNITVLLIKFLVTFFFFFQAANFEKKIRHYTGLSNSILLETIKFAIYPYLLPNRFLGKSSYTLHYLLNTVDSFNKPKTYTQK